MDYGSAGHLQNNWVPKGVWFFRLSLLGSSLSVLSRETGRIGAREIFPLARGFKSFALLAFPVQ